MKLVQAAASLAGTGMGGLESPLGVEVDEVAGLGIRVCFRLRLCCLVDGFVQRTSYSVREAYIVRVAYG